MKDSIHKVFWLLVLLLGVVVAICTPPIIKYRHSQVQKDTVYVYDTIRYSRLDLKTYMHKLDLRKIETPSLVFIPEESTKIIYKDSVRYVTLPREYFYTRTNEAEIWYSGVNPTIDSLAIFQKTATVTQTIKAPQKKNAVSLGVEANYSSMMRTPVHLEYKRCIAKWLNVYCYAEYDLLMKDYAAGLGANIEVEW